jgi:predicted methyltransferase
MRTLAKEPGRENVEVVSADLVAMPQATQLADVLWLHLFYHDQHAIKVFDPTIKGETDRFAYRFVKP